MRILHVATLVTPDGAYGGPIRVAINQLAELQGRGHKVALAAGSSGFNGQLPAVMAGVPIRLFPVHQLIPTTGFAGLISPKLQAWVKRQAPAIDIAHVHMARDLISIPAALAFRAARTPYVLQTHGMIDESSRRLAGVLDATFTTRALDTACAILYLTIAERTSLTETFGQHSTLRHLKNGVPPSSISYPAAAWPMEVLFMARLHPRKRPDIFVRACTSLADQYPDVKFTLVGPDEGMGSIVLDLIASSGHMDRISWEGALRPEDTLRRIARAAIFVLPAINEPFPMSVLEALSMGKPVIITDTCGLADAVRRSGAGLVVDQSLPRLVGAIARLIDDSTFRSSVGERAAALANDEFSMVTVTNKLEALYAGALSGLACEVGNKVPVASRASSTGGDARMQRVFASRRKRG